MVRATTLLPEVKPHYGDLTNYVGGAWRPPEATGWLEDTNPATGRAIARVPLSTNEEVLYQPLGVFAGISPFNLPVMVQFWFWPYAVATGNCWITKPSEQDPIPMQLVMDLVRQAGFPPGVVNLVHGAKETVNAILDH